MMRNRKIFLTIGIVIIIIPFLGVPENFKTTALFLIGILLVAIYFLGRKKRVASDDEELVYVENIEEDEEVEATPIEEIAEEKPEEVVNKFDKYFEDE